MGLYLNPSQRWMALNVSALCGMHELAQQDLADYIGVTKQSISLIVLGKMRASMKTTQSVSDAFGITIDDLFLPTDQLVLAAAHAYRTAPIRSVADARQRLLQPA